MAGLVSANHAEMPQIDNCANSRTEGGCGRVGPTNSTAPLAPLATCARGPKLRAGHRQNGLFDLCHREMTDEAEVEVRKVGHLVGGDNHVDDRRALCSQRFADCVSKLIGPRDLESLAPAG